MEAQAIPGCTFAALYPGRNKITKGIIEEPNVTYVEARVATYRHSSIPMQVPCDVELDCRLPLATRDRDHTFRDHWLQLLLRGL